MPETTNAARRFGKMIRQKDAEIAAHIDAKIEAISLAQEGEPEGLAWKKFSLLRTRKGLRLPGGVEIRQQVGDEAEEESEDEVEEGNGEEAGEEDELNQEINASRN